LEGGGDVSKLVQAWSVAFNGATVTRNHLHALLTLAELMQREQDGEDDEKEQTAQNKAKKMKGDALGRSDQLKGVIAEHSRRILSGCMAAARDCAIVRTQSRTVLQGLKGAYFDGRDSSGLAAVYEDYGDMLGSIGLKLASSKAAMPPVQLPSLLESKEMRSMLANSTNSRGAGGGRAFLSILLAGCVHELRQGAGAARVFDVTEEEEFLNARMCKQKLQLLRQLATPVHIASGWVDPRLLVEAVEICCRVLAFGKKKKKKKEKVKKKKGKEEEQGEIEAMVLAASYVVRNAAEALADPASPLHREESSPPPSTVAAAGGKRDRGEGAVALIYLVAVAIGVIIGAGAGDEANMSSSSSSSSSSSRNIVHLLLLYLLLQMG